MKYYVKRIVRHPVPGHTRTAGFAVVHKEVRDFRTREVQDGLFAINSDRDEAVARYLADMLCKDLNEGIE